jgi:hypothetical protein
MYHDPLSGATMPVAADDQIVSWVASELQAALVLILATKMMTDDGDLARALNACEARISGAVEALEGHAEGVRQ